MKAVLFSIIIFFSFSCSTFSIPEKIELELWICISYQTIMQAREKIATGEGNPVYWQQMIDAEGENFSGYMAEFRRKYGRFYLPEKECRR